MDWATDLDSELSRRLQVETFARYRGWFDALHATNADRLHEISEIERVESFSDERFQTLRHDLGKALLLTLLTEPAVLKIFEYRVFNLGDSSIPTRLFVKLWPSSNSPSAAWIRDLRLRGD
jgi:hypothetical protein